MLFSIITVCFNSAKTIRDTFESVLSQSCKDYEYLVIDGASTDGTVDIIKAYEPKFEGRMRWISEKDNGIYDAMNKGIKMSQGEYINFMGSDDTFETECLDKVKEIIKNNPHFGIYFGCTRWLNSQGEEKVLIRFHPNNFNKISGYSLCHQGVFEQKTLFEKYNYFSLKYRVLSDLHHMATLKYHNESFFPMDLCIASYSLTGISSTQNNKKELEEIRYEFGQFEKPNPEKEKREQIKARIHSRVNRLIDFFLMIGFRFSKIVSTPFK